MSASTDPAQVEVARQNEIRAARRKQEEDLRLQRYRDEERAAKLRPDFGRQHAQAEADRHSGVEAALREQKLEAERVKSTKSDQP